MITLQELCRILDETLQVHLFADYCENGLQVEGKKEITKIATGVSASLATIEAAAKLGADALIVHHGIFWNKDSYRIVGSKKDKISILLKNEISLLAYHLPLDAHQSLGNNWKAAVDMGWFDLEPFGGFNGIHIGVRGKFPKMSNKELAKKLEDYYQHPAHTAYGGKEMVQSAALISGGAYRQIDEASAAGVDCFITGNFDEPAWHLAHEGNINFYALGHSATERIGPAALAEFIRSQQEIPAEFIDIPNPF